MCSHLLSLHAHVYQSICALVVVRAHDAAESLLQAIVLLAVAKGKVQTFFDSASTFVLKQANAFAVNARRSRRHPVIVGCGGGLVE